MIAVLVGLVWVDAAISEQALEQGGIGSLAARGTLIPAAFVLLILLGTHELARLVRSAGFRPYIIWTFLSVAALNLGVLFESRVWPAAVWESHVPASLTMLLFLAAILGVAAMQIARGRTDGGIGDVAVTVLMITYLGLLPSFAIRLRADHPGVLGAYLVVFFLAAVKFTDIGAFFVGTWAGKRKLIPSISPKKTVEGLVGGILAAGPVCLVGRWVLMAVVDSWRIGILQALLLGVLMAVFGQLGDLLESVFKRAAQAKDSGGVVPEFGGILDIIDSPVLAAPVAWFWLTICTQGV